LSVVIKDLVVKYGDFKAVDKVSLRVGRGEVLTIVGPNGAGKTSLLKALVGIEPIADGVIEVCGKVFRSGERVKAPKYISYVPAVPDVDPWSRVEDLLRVATYGVGGVSDDYLRYVAKLLGIEGFMSRYFGSLSSGEGRLVMIATALVRRPKVVVMDEPLTFLDLRNQARVMGIIRKLANEETTVIVASHEVHLTPLYSDYVAVMSRGKVVAEGAPEEVIRGDVLKEVYGVELVSTEELRVKALVPKPEVPT